MMAWHAEQAGFARCSSRRSLTERCFPPVSFSGSGGTFAGGRGARRSQEDVQNPGAADHGRRPVRERGESQDAPLAEKPSAVLVGHGYATKAIADYVRNPVVLRQALVDERVVRGEQIEDAAVLADDAVEEELRLPPHGHRQVVVPIGEEKHVGMRVLQVLEVKPVGREARRERFGARVFEHPANLLLDDRRVRGLPALARVMSSSSGALDQNDSREASSKSLTRWFSPRAASFGVRSKRRRPPWVGEYGLEARGDLRLEVLLTSRGRIGASIVRGRPRSPGGERPGAPDSRRLPSRRGPPLKRSLDNR